jgi:hypothetical protein
MVVLTKPPATLGTIMMVVPAPIMGPARAMGPFLAGFENPLFNKEGRANSSTWVGATLVRQSRDLAVRQRKRPWQGV